MSTATLNKPLTNGPGTGSGGDWRVIVLNDSRNTFDHVASTLAAVIPGLTLDQGYGVAERIDSAGQAIVWSGPQEPAELYWDELCDAGLSMAPLERA